MSNIDNEKSGLTFCLVHGSFHGAWCWNLLRRELEAAGHEVVTRDIPGDEPGLTFEDYADIVSQDIIEPESTIVVGHSRMGNVLPRIASRKSVRKLIYLCAGFDKNNNRRLRHHFLAPVPDKYQPGYNRGLTFLDDNPELVQVERSAAEQIFYHDCTPEVAEWAAAQLRPQYRPQVQPRIKHWPETAMSFIYTRHDRVINPEYSEYVSRSLGARAVVLAGGHSPFLSRPVELAKILDAESKG